VHYNKGTNSRCITTKAQITGAELWYSPDFQTVLIPKFLQVTFCYCAYPWAVQQIRVLSTSSTCWESSGSISVSSVVFIVEDVDRVGDRGGEIPQRLMYTHSWRPLGTCHCNLPVVLIKFYLVKSNTSGLGTSFKCCIFRISELMDAWSKAYTIILNKCDKFVCNMSKKIHLLHSHVDGFLKDLGS